MTSEAARPLDEADVERAIADDPDGVAEPELLVAAPLEGVREDQAELDAEEDDASEAMRRAVDTGGPGPEERVLHVADPVSEVLDDEVDLDEATLDADQRDDVEWQLAAAPEPAAD